MRHVVVGAGPLGLETARALSVRGLETLIVSRRSPAADQTIECRHADATRPAELAEVLEGAGVVYNCSSPPYHKWQTELPPIWRGVLEATRSVGARLVIGTNLYAYGTPSGAFTENSPHNPCSSKGRVRSMLELEALAAHERGDLQVAVVRGSDFYGPGVTNSALGIRFFAPPLSGKPATLVGRLDVPHSYTFLADFAATMVAVGVSEETWGRDWIAPAAPPVTGRELEAALAVALEAVAARSADGDRRTLVKSMGRGALRFGGLFVPAARALVEMYYEFDRPFTVDATFSAKTLGLEATPLDRGFARTVEWFVSRSSAR